MKFILPLVLICTLTACSNHEVDKQQRPITRPLKDTPLPNKKTVNPYVSPDISPMDISYFPPDYPMLKMWGKTTSSPVARVIYSRPYTQGRQIFGSLLKYGEPWRLGANEATEIEIFKPVTVQGKTINPGRYLLYCIPQPDKWTVIFNTNTFTWGLRIDRSKDAYTFEVPTQQTTTPIEYFTMIFETTAEGANLLMAWDVVEARLPFKTK